MTFNENDVTVTRPASRCSRSKTTTAAAASLSTRQQQHNRLSNRALALALKAVAAREVRKWGQEASAVAAAKLKHADRDEQVARVRAREKAKRAIVRASRPDAMYGHAVAEANHLRTVGGGGVGGTSSDISRWVLCLSRVIYLFFLEACEFIPQSVQCMNPLTMNPLYCRNAGVPWEKGRILGDLPHRIVIYVCGVCLTLRNICFSSNTDCTQNIIVDRVQPNPDSCIEIHVCASTRGHSHVWGLLAPDIAAVMKPILLNPTHLVVHF